MALAYHEKEGEFKVYCTMREKPLILIVDDDKDFSEVIATKFKASGIDVAEAEDGDDGCRKATSLVPDLILMDVRMPKMNGIEALVEIKKTEATKHCKVVFLTAFGDTQPDVFKNDQKFAQEVGAFDYIVKTQDLDKIVEKVKEVLARPS